MGARENFQSAGARVGKIGKNRTLKSFETPASSAVLMKMHQRAGSEVTVIRQMHYCKQCLKDTCNYSCSGTMKYILFLK